MMKRFLAPLLCALFLSACASCPHPQGEPAPAQKAPLASDGTPRVSINGVEIEKVAFRAGVSSAAVEQLARQQACRGDQGAGLLTEPGPVEVYRMACDNGTVFRARCELRQCRPM